MLNQSQVMQMFHEKIERLTTENYQLSKECEHLRKQNLSLVQQLEKAQTDLKWLSLEGLQIASQLLEKTQIANKEESELQKEEIDQKPLEVEIRESEESDDDEGFTFNLSRWFKPIKSIEDAELKKIKDKVEEYFVTEAVKLINNSSQKLKRKLEVRKKELITFIKELKIQCQNQIQNDDDMIGI